MKLLKTVPAAVMLAGGLFASVGAMADDSVFTVMDDPSAAKKPFEGVVNAGYLAQSGNTKSSSMTAGPLQRLSTARCCDGGLWSSDPQRAGAQSAV